ncbi:MAG: type II secretion system protein [Kiritimatiellia bacterium]|jgi:prepilin-type N-terminal cleavage/methylation domain-containing protein
MEHSSTQGFSLIELLAVTAIIAIVVGMIGVAAFNARQRAYTTIASTEVQQIAQALKSYWIAKGEWPDGFPAGQDTGISADIIRRSGLRGDADGNVYLQLSDEQLEDGQFLDPWGHAYVVEIDDVTRTEIQETCQITVSFANSDKYYFE